MVEWIIKYWMQVLFGLICGVFAWMWHKGRAMISEQDAIKEGLLAMLHDRLYAECKRCIANTYITVEELRNIEYLYTAYHKLGGNGTGTELYNRAKALIIKEE